MHEHGTGTADVEALRRDRRRGARELARQALEDLIEAVRRCDAGEPDELLSETLRFAGQLRAARPAMPSIENLIGRWQDAVSGAPTEPVAETRMRLIDAARRVIESVDSAVEALAREAARLIEPGSTVITLSWSSTVAAVFRRLEERDVRAIVAESRPLFEGRALAEELAGLGIPTELITDAQIGLFAKRSTLALVGADAILSDGSVVNKAGTSLLAMAAREADVPFWVCAETHKRSRLEADAFPLEEIETSVLEAPRHERLTPRNIGFDVTPATLVTRWIDERGSTFGRPRGA